MPSSSPNSALGAEIPYGELHAVSVSLPTWSDNVAWASGNEDMVKVMSTGYPRFFVHRKIQQLADVILKNVHVSGKLSHLFPSEYVAQECMAYMARYAAPEYVNGLALYVVYIPLDDKTRVLAARDLLEVYAVTFPPDLQKLGKSYWQHTGTGITSRYAEACLTNLAHTDVRYTNIDIRTTQPKLIMDVHPAFQRVSQILQRRIAALALSGKESETGEILIIKGQTVAESDVFLYPSGMSAIWHAHQLIMALKPGLKYVCFGFPYTDTIKVLEKWGPGCIFFGKHPDDNLAELEMFLRTRTAPIAALFCECPSNPLLQSPNLPRLRELADEHGFLIIIDETIGTFVNVNVLQYVDIVTTSLSKLFSGKANVLGGSMVLNPRYKYYTPLKSLLTASYVNDFFLPDLMVVEENSRDFEPRVHKVDANSRAVCHYLRTRTLSLSKDSPESCRFVIKDIFYPEWITRQNYDLSRRPGRDDNFGHLFSLTFVSLKASEAFYNTLSCAKGPSLGTNFTLSCPYTLLGHWWERPWAAQFGVEEGIVRVSVGMEDRDVLMRWFETAVKAAEATLG